MVVDYYMETGNPSVVLIDEFSTGIDAKMKREMWITLRKVAVGKAVIITTRKSSMSYLLNVAAPHSWLA
jgi:ABC-type multidrug transport system ATPase subunit